MLFCTMRQNFPFLGLENSSCDADAQLCVWCAGMLVGGGDHLLQQGHRGVKALPLAPGSGGQCWVRNVLLCGRGL